MVNDPYKVLGVSKEATPEEIKSAYRKMAKQYHPDLHPDDAKAAEKMNEINEAYDMLTHPEKYASRMNQGNAYSSYSNAQSGPFYGYSNSGRTGYQGTGGWYTEFNGFDFDDLFGFGRYSGYTETNINPTVEPGDSETVKASINLINQGRYADGYRTLSQVHHSLRDARWYYLNAIALYGYKDVSAAIEYMKKAVQLAPENTEYMSILQSFRAEGQTYYRKTHVVINPFRTVGRVFFVILMMRLFFYFLQILMLAFGGYLPPM